MPIPQYLNEVILHATFVMVADVSNEKLDLASRKGPRSAQIAWNSCLSWKFMSVSYIRHIYM